MGKINQWIGGIKNFFSEVKLELLKCAGRAGKNFSASRSW